MTLNLEKIKALNYDHHRRMGEIHAANIANGKANPSAEADDQSYRSLLKNVPRDQSLVLELGSASGGQWKTLSEWGKELVGIDLYEPFVTEARKHGLPIYLGFVEDMAAIFPANHFDMVCSRHVMEHLGDVDRGIGEIKRILRPGGWSCHVTPDMPYDDEPAHLNKWKMWEWSAKWAEHGFQIISVEKREFNGGEVHVTALAPGSSLPR